MNKNLLIFLAFCMFSKSLFAESFGVCNREIDAVKDNIQSDYNQWIASVKDMPNEVREAYEKIFTYNRDKAYLEADKAKELCYAEFRPLQELVDDIVFVYTGGLSNVLPEHMTRVDISEIMDGKPLGGPNAAIPKFREQIFKGLGVDPSSPGLVGNVMTDPIGCLTLKKKC
ncbi:hypothetical protein C1S99_25310 [Vibrio parahaemolyticus]|uniref:hypothetical protein n=1 Tax=Vibrio parahaemolyticus TaxID=670 RepID=UPI000C869E40|nr:hypothetical protein [Vibrio parahaemolyticus]EJB8691747.1 hypothetical protein [Vibrio parahaemolyticus]PMS39143.1 hypothetical protein C1T12_25995 [Vibrio parahaemolyticus]PMS58032.1 hypothetical protein C1S91_25480 [Vibrio parahaemolyticus]PMS65386.1 hypothetical protein C1S96_25330 [Vibrio parahaemolyticus]PMS70548.1 hypothetical protein C1T10_25480 [Vibrio parahaemolyticus]